VVDAEGGSVAFPSMKRPSSRHAKVRAEDLTIVEQHNELLRPSPHRANGSTAKALCEARRERKAQVMASLLHRIDGPAFPCSLQTASNGFHFWEFRHPLAPHEPRT